MQPIAMPTSPARLILIGLLSWLSMLGFDFLLHGGVLAGLYVEPSPFLLSPAEAFKRIPLGYLAFLVLAIMLLWLMHRLRIVGWRPGSRFGLTLGGLLWSAQTLALLSISTADWALLVGWFVGQTLQFGIAGAVVGSGLAGVSLRHLSFVVAAFVIVTLVLTVVLQSLGLAPAVRM
ncbi:MAG: hypothetical protein EPO21_11545 [Chloroflexota bacterium]|nr:MAG: hypothetical protein EPO21_11545 [Chloroflexota bacterium]